LPNRPQWRREVILLKVIDGTILPDSGSVWRKPGLIIARLAQELPQNKTTTVYEFVAEGLADTGKILAAYYKLSERMAHSHTPGDLVEFENFHHEMDARMHGSSNNKSPL